MSGLRIIFMGTPDFAVPVLKGILSAGHGVVAVYTQPPRPAGRGKKDRPSPVQRCAKDAGIAVLTPKNFKNSVDIEVFGAHEADVAVVVAYGLILPKTVLDAPGHGCLNLHASLLPRWRGAAPIQRAIMAGDERTGIVVMRMEEGLDTGPVCLTDELAIGPDMTAGELHDALALSGAGLIVRALATLAQDGLDCQPQSPDGVTYAKKIEKAETRVDWSKSASHVHNHIRSLSPFPGAWFKATHGGRTERIKVLATCMAEGQGGPGTILDDALEIACSSGSVRLVKLQRAGKKPMDANAFLRGFPLKPGERVP